MNIKFSLVYVVFVNFSRNVMARKYDFFNTCSIYKRDSRLTVNYKMIKVVNDK